MSNPIVTSLPAYVEEHRLPLIAKSALGSKSARLFTLQSDVKGPTALNLVSTDIEFGDGSTCGWNPNGETALSQRILTPAYLKINMAYCDKNLLGTWAQYQVRIAAGQKDLPFEQDFVDGVVTGVDEALEKMIWQGDSTNDNEFDGMIKVLTDASATSVTGGTTAYDKIKNVYMAMPEAVASKEDAVIFVGAGLYREFIQDLVSANLYHFDPSNDGEEYKLPGTDIKVIKVNGLNETASYDYAVAGRLSNMFYGTDAMGDESKFDLWYSQDNREFRLAIEFTAGVQVAYPNEVILGKFSK